MHGESRRRKPKKKIDWVGVAIQILISIFSGLAIKLIEKWLNL